MKSDFITHLKFKERRNGRERKRETEVKKLNGLWGYLKGTPMASSRDRAFNVIFGIYFLLHNPSLQSKGVCVFVAGVFMVSFISLYYRTGGWRSRVI